MQLTTEVNAKATIVSILKNKILMMFANIIKKKAKNLVFLTPIICGKVTTLSYFISRMSNGKTKAEMKKKLKPIISQLTFGNPRNPKDNPQTSPT